MPKKKTEEIVRRIDATAPPPKKRLAPRAPDVPLITAFENKAGRYELIRVEGDQAYYSFTNIHGKTADAIMSAIMWRRMQARADATFKETA